MIAVTATLALCACVVPAASVGSEDTGIGAHVRWHLASRRRCQNQDRWLSRARKIRLAFRRCAATARLPSLCHGCVGSLTNLTP
jgi:hypothetical protein